MIARIHYSLRRHLSRAYQLSRSVPVMTTSTSKDVAKKDVMSEIPLTYNPVQVESDWNEWWCAQGFYKPECRPEGEPYVMVMPPPNVTGTLHLGHALTASIQDCLARWHRMNGRAVLWVPGTDHAGIATQVVVEKKLFKEKQLTRHDLGREKFLEEVWKWKNESGSFICNQLKLLGSSCDWSREAFTMDEPRCKAVQEAFLRMFNSGKIYRANRLVNWSSHLRTAISDIEVDYVTFETPGTLRIPGHLKPVEFGVFHSFWYQLEGSDSPDDRIKVATTRIETMLGDVAVAVHSEDERYKRFHGKYLKHPFFADRRVAVIIDDILVDPEKGTGAVKVTPAHDPNDFKCGQRHNLVNICVFDDEGRISKNLNSEFSGMMRFDARNAIIKRLDELGFYGERIPNPGMRLGICSRSGDVIEPMAKPQWWVDCKEMAERSTQAVRNGDLIIMPKSQERTWFQWLDNIQDWCISRQLWWGHRIPAYRILIDGARHPDELCDMRYWAVAENEEKAFKIAISRFSDIDHSRISLQQDEDVLDTWFSSGLFPFSVFDWPSDTSDFKKFFPNNLLETGVDILFFWVARMVMMSLELNGKLPFKYVFLHPMVRDKLGSKMSKSKGNVIDPLDVISGITLKQLNEKLEKSSLPEKEIKKAIALQSREYGKKYKIPGTQEFSDGIPECGTDGLRFGLLSYTAQGRNINLDVFRVLGYRQFCNKIWNAFRYSTQHFPKGGLPSIDHAIAKVNDAFFTESKFSATIYDLWIMSRLHNAIAIVNKSMEVYDFASATSAMYDFMLNEFCCVYLEVTKPIFSDGIDQNKFVSQMVLYICLDHILRLLHPVMPFVTEELWQRLPLTIGRGPNESIMVQSYPQSENRYRNTSVESAINRSSEIISGVLSAKQRLSIPESAKPAVLIQCSSPELESDVSSCILAIQTLAKCSSVATISSLSSPPAGYAPNIIDEKITVNIDVRGLIDFESELKRNSKAQQEVLTKIDRLNARMSTEQYQTKTPDHVKEKEIATLDQLNEKLQSIEKAMQNLLLLKGGN